MLVGYFNPLYTILAFRAGSSIIGSCKGNDAISGYLEDKAFTK